MGVKVAEKIMREFLLFRENFQTRDRVTRDAEHFSVIVNKISTTITNCAQFTRANSRECEWVEHDNDILLAVKIGKGNTLAELIRQGELGCAIADSKGHGSNTNA